MTDELLSYYNRELGYIRRLANQFVDDHSDAAARLRLRKDGTEDPHVSRLLEGFAYLTARIRRKLDDEFPEISSALLNALYPHYLAPVPSAGIVQFVLDRSQGELTTGYEVARGSDISLSDNRGTSCTFRTAFPTSLWPVQIARCVLKRRPFSAPLVAGSADAMSVLHLKLTCLSPKMTFSQFDASRFHRLRFFLQGQDHHVLPLYELLLNETRCVALAASETDDRPICLSPQAIQPVGFAPEEALLPYGARSFPGYRILTEYFAFPFKFHFVDLVGLSELQLESCGQELNIYFYFDRAAKDLENAIGPDTMRLGCTPIVNLFPKRAEPIKLTQKVREYHVIADARRRTEVEVYSIDHVSSSSDAGGISEYEPLYAVTGGAAREKRRRFWTSHRRPAETSRSTPDKGTEVFLSLVDLDLDPYARADQTLMVETTCLNRDLPGSLKRPQAELVQGGPFRSVDLLVGPTGTIRPTERRRGQWALISHLSLNHLSISHQDPQGHEDPLSVAAVQRILGLYDFSDTDAAKRKIEGILSIRHSRVVGRITGLGGGFCRGVEVTVEFDEDKYPDHGLFLFASILERFLALYCSINSFSRMTARVKQRDKVLRRWDPRTGDRVLL